MPSTADIKHSLRAWSIIPIPHEDNCESLKFGFTNSKHKSVFSKLPQLKKLGTCNHFSKLSSYFNTKNNLR